MDAVSYRLNPAFIRHLNTPAFSTWTLVREIVCN